MREEGDDISRNWRTEVMKHIYIYMQDKRTVDLHVNGIQQMTGLLARVQ